MTQNLSDIDFTFSYDSKFKWYWLYFDLLKSSKVKSDGASGLPINGFLLMFNSNIWPNYAPWPDIKLWNLNGIDIDLSCSPKVKYNGTFVPPYMNSYVY